MKKTVVIADDEPVIRMDLCEIFTEAGYDVVGQASDGFDALSLCRLLKPEIVLMDIKMPLLDGLKASKMIKNESLGACVILITSFFDSEFVEQAKDAGVMGYIIKPFSPERIIPEVEVLVAKNAEIQSLIRDLHKTTEELEGRKYIERAKGKLMADKKLAERDAYGYMRKLSMDKRCSMVEIAKILLME